MRVLIIGGVSASLVGAIAVLAAHPQIAEISFAGTADELAQLKPLLDATDLKPKQADAQAAPVADVPAVELTPAPTPTDVIEPPVVPPVMIPDEPVEPEVSTRGHKVGDRVVLGDTPQDAKYGDVVEVVNGHAVVQFDEGGPKSVMVGATMDQLHIVSRNAEKPIPWEAPATSDDTIREVASEDFHVKVANVIKGTQADIDEVHAIVVVSVGSGGEIILSSSEGTPLTLNLLAQGIKVADGTYEPADA